VRSMCLLIQAQNHCIGWRIEIEAHHIVDLLFRRWIRRELEGLHTMRLQNMCPPDPMHRGVRNTLAHRDLPGAPMSQPRRRRLQCQGDNPGSLRLRQPWRTPQSWLVRQPVEPLLCEPAPNPADLYRRVIGQTRNLGPHDMIRHQQHGASSTGKTRRSRRRPRQSLQLFSVRLTQVDRPGPIGHAPSSTECTWP